MEATDVGVRNGRIAALGVPADATADATIDAKRPARPARPDRPARASARPRRQGGGNHPHRHQGRRARRPRRGVRHAEHRPVDHRRRTTGLEAGLRRSRSPGATWASMSAAPRPTSPRSPHLELGRGVCGIKIFAGSSTGDLMVEDDEHLERVMRSGRRRIAYHREDEYRLQARKHLFKSGDPYASPHGMARRGMRLPRHPPADGAGPQDRPAGAYPARLHRRGTRLPEGFSRHRHLRGAGQPPDPGRAGLLRAAGGLRGDEPADPRPQPHGRRLGGDQRRHGRHRRLRPRAASARRRSCCPGRIAPPA